MNFLTGLLVIIGVYYVLKYLVRFFAPKILNYAAKKTEQHFKEKFGEFSKQAGGDATYTPNTSKQKKTDLKSNPAKKVGEYIDFEEIE